MQAVWKGTVIAEHEGTRVVEGNHYFPPDSLVPEHFEDSGTHTICGWKGEASYKTVVVDGARNPDAAWYYPDPKPAADEIRGWFAFWKGVEVKLLPLVLALLLAASPARAEIGALDNVPAATLLLPYFEVGIAKKIGKKKGATTLFSINNASASPTIAHVTLWTNLGIPAFAFNVFLTGFDVVSIDLADLFATGTVPPTSHRDTAVSPRGVLSATFNPISGVGPGSTSCNEQLPNAPLPEDVVTELRARYTGQAAPSNGLCWGFNHGDGVARGFVTIDSVNFCTTDVPGDLGYFIAGGFGSANNLNQLWGDYFYVGRAKERKVANGQPLIALEASNSLGAANYTFYRKLSGGADQREGLTGIFGARFRSGGKLFNKGTQLTVWRDPKQTITPFSCTLLFPSPYPLEQTQLLAFDEQENPVDVLAIEPFPLATNSVPLGGLAIPFASGWLFANVHTAVAGSQVPFEPLTGNWLGTEAFGSKLSAALPAVQLDNVTGQPDPP